MKAKLLALLLGTAMLLSACGTQRQPGPSAEDFGGENAAVSSGSTGFDSSKRFSDRDFETDYDEDDCVLITLSGDTAQCSHSSVSISGGTVSISGGGSYILRGSLENGMIIVSADSQTKTRLILDGVSVRSAESAALYILQANKVFITLAEGSENTLENGGSFTPIDENSIDAAVFSKDDLCINGSGSLSVISPAGHGIVSKDDLRITGGSFYVSCAGHGLCGRDAVSVAGGSFEIISGKDGVQSENDEDSALGSVYIGGGSFSMECEGDGISAGSTMHICGGSFDILCGGGAVNGEKQTSDSWGGFMGGNPPGMGGGNPPGGNPPGMGGGRPGGNGGNESSEQEDSTSIKGLKSAGSMLIEGGEFIIDSADDAVHSNSGLFVKGGTFHIATGDDGFHADGALEISHGSISISESYEGLEGLSILISGGEIRLIAADDGLNAAGGADQSGFGGMRGGDKFAAESGCFITISGGKLNITASGDGIDSNGALTISGGTVYVCGPTNGDTAVLDFTTGGVISGGTFIGSGAYMMAQTFSDSSQGVISLSVGNRSAGTEFTLTDAEGSIVAAHSPEMDYAIVIISTPEMVKGETYTFSIGGVSDDFEAS